MKPYSSIGNTGEKYITFNLSSKVYVVQLPVKVMKLGYKRCLGQYKNLDDATKARDDFFAKLNNDGPLEKLFKEEIKSNVSNPLINDIAELIKARPGICWMDIKNEFRLNKEMLNNYIYLLRRNGTIKNHDGSFGYYIVQKKKEGRKVSTKQNGINSNLIMANNIKCFVATFKDDGCTLAQIMEKFNWTEFGAKAAVGRAINSGHITKHPTLGHYYAEEAKAAPYKSSPERIERLKSVRDPETLYIPEPAPIEQRIVENQQENRQSQPNNSFFDAFLAIFNLKRIH